MGYQFKSPNTLMEALPEPSAAQVAQAVAKLERCSDRGLEDLFLFLHARLSGEHLLGRLLLEGLDSEEEVNTLHNAAWHIWHGSTHPPEMEFFDSALVLDLSDEGVLPPIMSYCATSRAEFIEFCRPADPDSVLHKDGSTLYPMVWFR
eukprot:gene20766-27590_t